MKNLNCVVSVSGLRGIVGETIDASQVLHLAALHGMLLCGRGTVVLGRDSRPTGEVFAQAAAVGLRSVGCNVVDLGVVPTPTVAIMVKELGALGGIMVSASHNPVEWNALKFFNKHGRNITKKELDVLMGGWEHPPADLFVGWQTMGRQRLSTDALDIHLKRVLSCVDVAAIRAAHLTVLVDSVNGAGSVLSGRLMEALGVRCIPLYNDPQRPFPRDPEPTAEKVVETGKVVKAVGAAIGFVQDPDADRLAIIDERGRYIGEEYTLVLCAAARLAAAKRLGSEEPIAVTNLSTSRMLEDVATSIGGRVVRTAVGEANVVDGMEKAKASIGGEGNGGVIDPRVVWGRDSHIGMALVLEHLATTGKGKPLSEVINAIPSYEMLKTKIPLDRATIQAATPMLRSAYASGAQVDDRDGIKFSWPDRWIHIRASGTEPVSRIIAEAPDATSAKALVQDCCKRLRTKPF